MQTKDNGKIKCSVVTKEGALSITNYYNGLSEKTDKLFSKVTISKGLYIGELRSNMPNGWGVCFLSNGFIWYGKWNNGTRNGIGYECDFDGKKYKVGYWKLDNFII